MSDLLDYIARETATFDEKPFGELDAAILTQAAMIDAPGTVPAPPASPGPLARIAALVSPGAAGASFADVVAAAGEGGAGVSFTGLVPGDIRRLLFALAASPRYRGLRLRDLETVVDDAAPVQFGAMTFTWRDRFAFVGFRGTDAPFPGWRENLDMCWSDEVGAQRLARAYLERVAAHLPRRIELGGHSKGGNLALYAALTCQERVLERVRRVWTLDAPGFRAGRFDEGDAARLAGRVERIVPVDAVVGMLLEDPFDSIVVESSAAGLMQHSVFSWRVALDGFVRLERPSDFSCGLHDVVAEWLAGMDGDARREVVDALSAAVAVSGAGDAGQLLCGGAEALGYVREAARRVDGASREVLNRALGELAQIAVRRVGVDAAAALQSIFG